MNFNISLCFSVSVALFALVSVFGASASAETLIPLGSVYECAHGFKGNVFVKNDREIIIKGFHYDGGGPAAWFHGQLKGSKGVYTSDPNKYMTLPYPDDTCDRLKVGRAYNNEEITLILPVSIKKFQTIGILCYQFCHNFGHVIIPDDLTVPAAPAGLLLPNECPKPNYKACPKTGQGEIKPNCKGGSGPPPQITVTGKSLGRVYECAHGFKGEVFVKNDREIFIKGMSYDGAGPAAWFHGQLKGSKSVYTSDPDKYMTLPYPDGTCDRLKVGRAYNNEDVTLILPVSIKKFRTIGILCYQFCHNFGHIIIPEDLTVPEAPANLLLPQECPKPNYKACEKTGQGEIKPKCEGGNGEIFPDINTSDAKVSSSDAKKSSDAKVPPNGGEEQTIPSVFVVIIGTILVHTVCY